MQQPLYGIVFKNIGALALKVGKNPGKRAVDGAPGVRLRQDLVRRVAQESQLTQILPLGRDIGGHTEQHRTGEPRKRHHRDADPQKDYLAPAVPATEFAHTAPGADGDLPQLGLHPFPILREDEIA